MVTLGVGDLWGREAYRPSGEYLGRIEAVGMGRDRVPRRVGVRSHRDDSALTFFRLAGASLEGDRLTLDTGPKLEVVQGGGS